MIIPTGMVHDAAITAEGIRELQCEKCHRPFFLRLARTGKGRSTASFLENQEKAASQAADLAQARLEWKLASGVDPVPCPHCDFYQPQMVKEARARLFPWSIGIAAVAICHFGLGYLLSVVLPSAPGLVFFLPGIMALGVFLLLRQAFDPNRAPSAAARLRKRFPQPSYRTLEVAQAASARVREHAQA
ncbi:MAG: hypothetical protein HY825_01515 [Acidobacteria bacterium]|nr:hypothetical protein [Acidobacteriota bacterium]